MPNLAGARIWLSGSIPDPSQASESQRESIAAFISGLALRIFEFGGHVVHGSHPTVVPLLVTAAAHHQQRNGRKDCLTLVTSRYYARDADTSLAEWNRHAMIYETDIVDHDEVKSLAKMREWIAGRSDAVVHVGGAWWAPVNRNGVPAELTLALSRHVPCFLIGGLGGAAARYLETNPEVLQHLQNGWDDATNHAVSTTENVRELIGRVSDQLCRLPLVRGRGTDGVSFRILALDGGGIKGTFTAAALATWERLTGLRVVEHFDLIAGTSTGGILAIGLGLGLSGEQMLDFYRQRGPVIFPMTSLRSRWRHGLRHIWQPKFAQAVLYEELKRAYYTRTTEPIPLRQSRCRLVIPSYHALAGGTHVFRTPHHPLLTSNRDTMAADAALATAAAPTYFSAAEIKELLTEASYFDGGVWANSPALAAIVEAQCYLEVPLDRIDVLSVGTTDEPFTVSGQKRAGVLGWASRKRILQLLMNAQEDASLKHAKLLAGAARFLRVNATTVPRTFSLDDVRSINDLAALGQRAAQDPETLAQVRSRFLTGIPAARWQSH